MPEQPFDPQSGLSRELKNHLDLEAEELERSGLPPGEAHRQSRRLFGNTTRVKEAVYEMTGPMSLERLWRDLRYGAALLARNRGFSAVAILTLALGIGANSAIFTVVNALLLRPLPYPDASRLVRIWPTDAHKQLRPFAATSYPNFLDWQSQSRALQQVEIYVNRAFSLTGGPQPERIRGLRVSTGFLDLLGVTPALGRGFLPEEIQPGKDHVVLLTDGLWKRYFASDPNVLGANIRLNDESYTVAGVLPGGFQFPPNDPADLLLPQPPDASRTHGFVNVVGRLKAGSSIAEAQTEIDTIGRRLDLQYPNLGLATGARVLSLHGSYVKDARLALLIFLISVGFVLLIACANVANLFLARSAARQREFVVRAALGASRLRLIRQLLTESVLVGLAGGTLGLLFAVAGARGLAILVQENFPSLGLQRVNVDAAVLAFTFAIAIAVGLLSGFVPALTATRLDLNDTLKEGARGLTSSRRRNRFRGALVVAEIALALVLLIGAGLTIKSLVLLENVNPGIRPENILTASLGITGQKYARIEARAPFVNAVLQRVGQLPGVESAAVITDIPLSGDDDTMSVFFEGRPDPGPNQRPGVNLNIVSPGYLRTMGIPLRSGRDLAEQDVAWLSPGRTWFSVAGITGDVRQSGLGAEPQPEIYVSYLQDPFAWPYLNLLVRTSTDPMRIASTVQSSVWSVDKDVPIPKVRTMEQIRSGSIAQPRVTALLLAVFASLALALAAIGIYGVMAYSVSQRTHEMGLRMALGARAKDVRGMVVGQGLLLAGAGVLIGLAGAFALTRVLEKLLWGVRPTDPATFAAVSAVLIAVAFLASYVPARRATRVDPMIALRYE